MYLLHVLTHENKIHHKILYRFLDLHFKASQTMFTNISQIIIIFIGI